MTSTQWQGAPFHLALPVSDLAIAEGFYGDLLGCPIGRRSEGWIDFDFGGHQVTTHLVRTEAALGATNDVDGDNVPVRHFGLVLPMPAWEELASRLKSNGAEFVIEPHVRFAGQVGEQATMFLEDGCGNALEFKAFVDPSTLFEHEAR